MKKTIFAKSIGLFVVAGLLLSLISCAMGSEKEVQDGDSSDVQGAETVKLPDERPEDFEMEDQEDDALVAVSENVRMNYDFIVRYTQSNFERTAQLAVPSTDTVSWKWKSSDTTVALVNDAGLVTCNTKPGEAKITATNEKGVQATCWVYVLEPNLYMRENSYEPYYFLEGDISLRYFNDEEIYQEFQKADGNSSIEWLPYMFVENGTTNNVGEFVAPSVSKGGTTASIESGMFDQDGNPIMIYDDTGVEAADASDGDIDLHLGWYAVYFGGRYRLPSRLQSEDATYTPTRMRFDYESYIQEISIPATIQSIEGSNISSADGDTVNPFSKCVELEEISVDEGNPSYSSDNGALLSADGKILIAVPAAAKEKEYTVPETVTVIGGGAFENNKNIETVVIPASVQTVSETSFAGMTSLKKISLEEGNAALAIKDGVLVADAGQTLLAASPSDMPAEYTVDENVTAIGSQVFSNNNAVKDLTINASSNYLSLSNCSSLETLSINGDISWLYVNNCNALKTVVINGNVSNGSIVCDKVESISITGKVDSLTLHSNSLRTITGSENIRNDIQLACKNVPKLEMSDTLEFLTVTMDEDGVFDFDAIHGGSNLNKLSVQSYSAVITIDQFSAIEKLQNLVTLSLRSVKTDDWSAIWKCSKLRYLDIQNCNDFTSVEGIGALTELCDLSLSGSAVSDLSPLANCEKLAELDISNCKSVRDISGLKGLRELNQIASYGSEVPQEQLDEFKEAGITVY